MTNRYLRREGGDVNSSHTGDNDEISEVDCTDGAGKIVWGFNIRDEEVEGTMSEQPITSVAFHKPRKSICGPRVG